MGFNPPVPQDDSDWEIRVAVLVSLLLQVLLIFLGPMRKRSSHPFPRFLVWSCYLLADWVADLTLGLLLNNMGNIGGGGGGSRTSSWSSGSNKRGGGSGNTTINNNSSSSTGSPIIFAFWTPFLLLHLGGPDTITSFSLEDNELWLRHLIGLLFELFSALVIFGCSIHGNPMIPATVLMFVAGIIKYMERTYCLYFGSVEGFRGYIGYPPDPGPNYAKFMTEFNSRKKAGLLVRIDIANGIATKAQIDAELEEMQELVVKGHKSVEARAYEFFLTYRRLFVFANLILSSKERRKGQAFFLTRDDPGEAFEVIEVELNYIYDMLHTKGPVAHSRFGLALRLLCSGCLVASLVIFFFLHKAKHGIRRVDIAITYALLVGALALDAAALLMLLFSNHATVYLESSSNRFLQWLARLTSRVGWRRMRWQNRLTKMLARRWAGKTSQLNLISHCVRMTDKRDRWWLLNKMAKMLRLEGILDDLFFIKLQGVDPPGKKEGNGLLVFIFDDLKMEIAKLTMREKAEYRKLRSKDLPKERLKEYLDNKLHGIHMEFVHNLKEVCDCRGERTINENKQDILAALNNYQKNNIPIQEEEEEEEEDPQYIRFMFRVIMDSVDRTKTEFEESLLLWHIATDLCLLQDKKGLPNRDPAWMQLVAKTLSEYMLYLLIRHPEMLSATASIGLLQYWDTCAELRRFLGPLATASWNPHPDNTAQFEEYAKKMLLNVNTSERPSTIKGSQSRSVLFDAVILAKALRAIGDDDLIWTVIAGVWREMLTSAAAKCMGSTHIRQLSCGGELITLVWFLMTHMGFGDIYQMRLEDDPKAKLIIIDQ